MVEKGKGMQQREERKRQGRACDLVVMGSVLSSDSRDVTQSILSENQAKMR